MPFLTLVSGRTTGPFDPHLPRWMCAGWSAPFGSPVTLSPSTMPVPSARGVAQPDSPEPPMALST